MPQSWINRGWESLANAFLPGTPFNTSSDSVGASWQNGDWSKAGRGDGYSMARIGAGFLPLFGNALGTGLVNLAERRAINKYENDPSFTGPARNYDSGQGNKTGNGAQARIPQFQNSINPNDPVSMSLLMGSLGFTGTTGGYGPDLGRLFHPLVK